MESKETVDDCTLLNGLTCCDLFSLDSGVTLIRGDCRDVMPRLTGIDAVISDPPFSDRTHAGHDAIRGDGRDGANREGLGYEPWGDLEVKAVCDALPDSGWVCILTDHILAQSWEQRLKERGRYVFAPIPIIVKGRSVRLTGDGPSSWTDWMVPSRTKSESKWGTLPGVYEGVRGSIEHMGGKPLNAMCRIVEDYSRESDTVLDFCMGAGTTGIACIRTGRKFIGIEKDQKHFDAAKERIEIELAQGNLFRGKATEIDKDYFKDACERIQNETRQMDLFQETFSSKSAISEP